VKVAVVAAVTAAAAAVTTTTVAAVTATAAGTDNNQLKAVTAMANAGGDGNSDDIGGRWRRRHDNGGGGGGVTHEAAGGDALIGTWAKAEVVDAAPAIFSDAGVRTWIFLGRIFCARKQAFYGRTKFDFILPVVLLCYRTQKYPVMRRGICRTYVRYGTKMYGSRNYYRPPLDEASKIILKRIWELTNRLRGLQPKQG
jgi:hypothetical protein